MKKRIDQFVIGFALFSMFFGAGNIIFPPYLGLGSGPAWITGFICYYIADTDWPFWQSSLLSTMAET